LKALFPGLVSSSPKSCGASPGFYPCPWIMHHAARTVRRDMSGPYCKLCCPRVRREHEKGPCDTPFLDAWPHIDELERGRELLSQTTDVKMVVFRYPRAAWQFQTSIRFPGMKQGLILV
jgi:hypothetical protein